MSDELICVGAIAGSFGVQGEVRLKSFCTEAADIAAYGPVFTKDGRSFTLKLTRPVAGGLGGRLSGVTNKEDADALKGTELFVPRAKLPKLPDDEFYHSDLIGLTVRDTGGETLGEVISVHNHGAGDILEIRLNGPKSALLLPFTLATVPTVDLAGGLIIVDLPEGLD
ncbi:ribosome maturation factor RimM [Xinfangfangia sp. CPCC 101601]|uniref:Ribosome maturation factor RimM n=1 Tax=Pseudogemmobacter lacusdianii TaxID=3069608 RepID=A0ABU0W116_9RHOB|nr:ribosome maturation factor RimM [Xinfangfangia sp. CPCC 101601]MDQ2067453.1 ribosome maturation factor RimM [Xinfangfangia sp. CPCC 101601]